LDWKLKFSQALKPALQQAEKVLRANMDLLICKRYV
jgi:hypothetical protein